MILGITGSIATGKSLVSKFFVDLGAHLIDWDVLGHEVMQPKKEAWQGIVEYFGKDVLNEDSTINREVLGRLVFNKPDRLSRLNEIVHPEIMKVDQKLVNEIRGETPCALIVKEIALMSERGKRLLVDKAVVVCSSEENQIKRLAERGISEEDAKLRIRAQLPMTEKLKLADFVINNDGTKEETKKQVEIIYNQVHFSQRKNNCKSTVA
ncbi:MAG: dephospho-CoA kinase [Thermodesulfobacteriota bacterium]|nr:dephospho-CoA kinase [Thermodesulfobacteriota bacterium]